MDDDPNDLEGRTASGDAPNDASPPTQKCFHELVRQWKEATAYISSTTEMATHPAYQQIIGMGREALPLIFDELRREPDHWFWALKSITREDPVAAEDRGKLQQMTRAWLDWAKHHGFWRDV